MNKWFDFVCLRLNLSVRIIGRDITLLFEDLHLSISHVLALGAGIINTHIVAQNQATKSNRNLTNDLHQSRPAHFPENSSHSVTFMLDDGKKDASVSKFIEKSGRKQRAGSL